MLKRIWLPTLICIFVVVGYLDWHYKKRATDIPVAEQGVINITAYDFKKNVLPLNGQWEFYPNQLLEPEDFQNKIIAPSYIQVPGSWSSDAGTGQALDKWGYGTYRLTVKNDHASNYMMQYGIRTTTVFMSYKLFIDGQLRASSGQPAQTKETYVPSNLPDISVFDSRGDHIEIIIQVANFDHHTGGITTPIYLGYGSDMLRSKYNDVGLQIGVATVLIVFFIVFLLLFIFYDRNIKLLLIALFFFFFSINITVNKERLLIQRLSDLPFEAILTIKHLAIYISAPLLSYLTICLFGRRKESLLHILVAVAIGLYCMMIIVLPYREFIKYEPVALIVLIAFYVFLFLSLVITYLRKNKHVDYKEGLRYYLFGVLALLFFRLNNILYARYYFTENQVSTLSILAFIIFISLMLVQQYWKIYTDKDELTRQLRSANKRKDEFLLRTSAELKTPIYGLINLTQSILEQPEETRTDDIGMIRNTAFRMSNIVDGIVDLIKLKDEQITLHLKQVDLSACTAIIMEQFQFTGSNKNIIFQAKISEQAKYVEADEQRYIQVLYHLIDNFFHYIEVGTITISSRGYRDEVCVTIAMNSDDTAIVSQDFIFEAFERRDKLKEQHILGLDWSFTVVNRLVTLMNGRLEMTRSKEKHGYQFDIWLPALNSEPLVSQEEAVQVQEETTSVSGSLYKAGQDEGIYSVLVVDSDVLSLGVIVHLLGMEGFKVRIARTEEEAWNKLETPNKPDIVLLNMLLNGSGGYTLCREIRRRYSHIELPILFIAARNTPIDIESGLESGGNDYITRPFDAGEVRARIHTLLAMKRLSHESALNELAFLRSQIKPHFLYNTLGTIMSLCYTDGRSAGRLISVFSKYLRLLFQFDPREQELKLYKELEFVKTYFQIERARYGEKLQFDVNVDSTLLDYAIAPMMIQPLVENAIRHGIAKQVNGGFVRLSIDLDGEALKIVVEDNGVGMSDKKRNEILQNTNDNSGIGLANIIKRVRFLTEKPLVLESSEGVGTTIILWLPIKKQLK